MSDEQKNEEFEFKTETIPIDVDYERRCSELKAEGWQTVPSAPPIAIFNLFRPKPQPVPSPMGGALGVIRVDDTKVHVIRDGKIVG